MERGTLILGVLIAVGLGALVALWPSLQQGDRPRPDPAGPASRSEADPNPLLYKWKDDKGVWNYTDRPPRNTEFEIIRDTPNVTPVGTVVPEVPSSGQAPAIPPPPED